MFAARRKLLNFSYMSRTDWKVHSRILYVKINVCLFVCMYVWNIYKFTFLNRSEPNFAHISPMVWKRP